MIYKINKEVVLEESMGRVGSGLIGAGVGLGTLGAVAGYRAGTKIYDAPTKR